MPRASRGAASVLQRGQRRRLAESLLATACEEQHAALEDTVPKRREGERAYRGQAPRGRSAPSEARRRATHA